MGLHLFFFLLLCFVLYHLFLMCSFFAFEKNLYFCKRITQHSKQIPSRQNTPKSLPPIRPVLKFWSTPPRACVCVCVCTRHFWWPLPSDHLLPCFLNLMEEDRQFHLTCSRAVVWIFTLSCQTGQNSRCN